MILESNCVDRLLGYIPSQNQSNGIRIYSYAGYAVAMFSVVELSKEINTELHHKRARTEAKSAYTTRSIYLELSWYCYHRYIFMVHSYSEKLHVRLNTWLPLSSQAQEWNVWYSLEYATYSLSLCEKLPAGLPSLLFLGSTRKVGVPPGITARDTLAGVDGRLSSYFTEVLLEYYSFFQYYYWS
jgi:hypothetical protein